MTPGVMTAQDLDTALDWAAHEGWNPGQDDAAAFRQTDPQGFFVGRVDGAPVSAISVVNHTDDLAFLGLYLCLPDHRGQGHGYALWQHALAHAGDRTVGLDGVPDQQANYARSGFHLADRTWRYEGTLPGAPDPAVRPARATDHPALIAREAAATGYSKPRFMTTWLTDTATRRTVMLEDAFATYRQCRDGTKIGPLVASDVDQAARLIGHIASLVGGHAIIDVPESCTGLTAWCTAQGLQAAFNTARMYRGVAPTPESTCYAIATMELG